jgi:hypothetical protein
MHALCRQARPGGMLLIDHYTPDYPATATRRVLRRFLLPRSPKFSLRFCRLLVGALWPLHRLTHALRFRRGMWRARQWLLAASPVVDYQDAYPQLGLAGLYEWAILDTHDTLTDRYKHFRTAEQIRVALERYGMRSIESQNAGNGVEVRAVRMIGAAAGIRGGEAA